MRYKQIISTLLLLLFVVAGVSAQPRVDRKKVRVSGFELVQERGQATVDFTLDIGLKAAAKANTLSIIPVLKNGPMSLELTPVVVRGRRAGILYERRAIASPRTARSSAGSRWTG